jgi:hypothetical protein
MLAKLPKCQTNGAISRVSNGSHDHRPESATDKPTAPRRSFDHPRNAPRREVHGHTASVPAI